MKQFINERGKVGNCEFCQSKDVKCVPIEILEDLFLPLVNLYTPAESIFPTEFLKEYQGEYIWEKINTDWLIFSDITNSKRLIKGIFSYPSRNGDILLDSYYVDENEHFGEKEKDSEFHTFWDEFKEEIKHKNRFFPDSKLDQNKLVELLSFLEMTIPKGKEYYRSRITNDKCILVNSELGKPSKEWVLEGRANPVGIPYLYLASDEYTAIVEVRPSLQDIVAVGTFVTSDVLRIIDLRDISPFQFRDSEDFESTVKHISFLKRLGIELSKTINPKDAKLEYLPTQYLCELIKKNQWDGVFYNSSLGKGWNTAIFTDNKMNCQTVRHFCVNKYNVEYTEYKI